MSTLVEDHEGIDRQPLFGLSVDALTLGETVSRCERAIEGRRTLVIGVVNAAKMVNLRHDDLLRESLLHCDLVLADGQSVVWASRLLRHPVPERIAGIDLFTALLRLADTEHRSVYLLGARPKVLAALIDNIAWRFPGVRIAGARDGYFDDADAPAVAAEIRAAAPDMLFLGMTSPKKELFLGAYGADLDVPLQHGVGGSFDVLAGVTRRAPEQWQRAGMEWAYRLLQEPRRLVGRYARTNTAFLGMLLHDLVRETPAYRSVAMQHA